MCVSVYYKSVVSVIALQKSTENRLSYLLVLHFLTSFSFTLNASYFTLFLSVLGKSSSVCVALLFLSL